MSNLTVGLAIVGGLVLAGVVAHGAWTTRRNAPKILRTEHARLDDDLAPRQEPGLDDMALGSNGGTSLDEAVGSPATNPGLSQTAVGRSSFGRTLPPAERRPALDALIDLIAPMQLDHPVSGEAVMQHMPTTRRAGSKPFAIEARNERTRQWELPQPLQRYDAFQAGVQLANRSGALNEIEFSEFVQKANAFADSLDASATFPDMREEVARARELDTFAASHDAQLGVTVRARNAAWSAGFVQLHATRQGFVAGAVPGRMVLPASAIGAPPILVLNFDTQAAMADDPSQTALRSVALSLDVPHVERAEQPFVRMRDVAITLAASMDGTITDDRGAVLMADALDAIGADLEALYDALQERDLAAGSALARRLFS